MNHLTYEKAILVGCRTEKETEENFISSMKELEALTETAGGQSVAELSQKRVRPHPATYIGKGKTEELISLTREIEPDVVIFNDELSPSQLRNLSKMLDVRLIDRTQLILDIFAQRARSREGQLQVELAQLKYAMPRLVGQGTELSRQAGGIGTRGPGETKLETDRRSIRKKIDEIKRQLETIVSHRERYRERRKHNSRFTFSLAGYTNAGKSTLFNRLANADVYEENQLFATLDPTTRECVLPSGFKVLLSDTVGFIQDLPTSLIAAFRSTLEEVTESEAILHVVDSSHLNHFIHEQTVYSILNDLDATRIPQLTVYNKKDLTSLSFLSTSKGETIHISAFEEDDLKKLLFAMEKMVKEQMLPYRILLEAHDGKSIARLKEETIVEEIIFDEENNTYQVVGYALTNHPVAGLVNPVLKSEEW